MSLEILDLHKAFGGHVVISDLSLAVDEGAITALVGPNGAGKTTLFNLITGFLRPDHGSVRYRGRELVGLSPQRIARLGLVRSFQGLRLFNDMSVYENVLVGQENSLRLWQRGAARLRANSEAVLRRVGLWDHRGTRASNLSYAEKKFLNLARIMALGSEFLLLDEPASGLDGISRTTFHELLRALKEEGRSILLIEHNLDIVRAVSDRIAFLDEGALVAVGMPDEIFSNQELARRYFGGSAK